MTEVWTQWEGVVVNGVYPLRRFLNASDHSAVFLTESAAEGFRNAAIKFVTADPVRVDVQLWHWKTAATFSHPHLIRLLDSGPCEIDGRPLLFVVMEHAEQTLGQILPHRALSAEEVRELLVPSLEALAFLHRESWVQGQLKPSNILVVNDQLKLAVDTIRPAGVSREKATQPTLYDPPEVERGEISQATDMWALGVTLVEALTQYPPTWPQGRSEPPALPANLPAFGEIIQRCLSVNAAERPAVADLQLLMRTSPAPEPASPTAPTRSEAVASTPVAEPVLRAMPPHSYSSSSRYASRSDFGGRSWTTPAIVAVVVVIVAVWGSARLFRGHAKSSPTATVAQTSGTDTPQTNGETAPGSPAQQGATAPTVTPPPAEQHAPATQQHAPAGRSSPTRPPATTRPPLQQQQGARPDSTAVVHEEIPRVSQSARDTIRGHVRVSVRVVVNKSGSVVHDTFENASSSRYFNRVASEAARKWRFAAADSDRSREWLLHFEFGREGTTVHATRSRS